MQKINIAIDGPAGAGKSTIAKLISKALQIIYLDTGAMYRAVALKVIESGIDMSDVDKIEKLLEVINIDIQHKDNEQYIMINGENVTEKIRTPEISLGASKVAVIPQVRIKMVELQREIARNNSVVMDGRDIGTYVLPDADYKFFLTADIDVRAMRRYNEQISKNITHISLEDVKKDIEFRDKNDSSRAFAPLAKAQDAIEVDTSNMDIESVVKKILNYVKRV